jgi:hypothetical protein
MANKLGLTLEERTIFYTDTSGKRYPSEVRRYDPIAGLAEVRDPMNDKQIEFLWNSSTSKWEGLGLEAGYIALLDTAVFGTPITKQTDSNVPDKATSVSRFPT